jgi:integrase
MPRRRRQGANLYLRGSTWWCWYYDAAGEQQRRSTHQRERSLAAKVAEQLERECIEALERPPALPLVEAFASWLDHLESHERAADTLDYYHKRVRALLRELGEDTDAHELTLSRMDAYVATRQATSIGKSGDKHISRATIAKELGALRSCLLFSKKRGKYRGEPASIIPDMRGAYVPRDRALSLDEYRALLDELAAKREGVEDRRDYLVAYVGLGASMSELYRIEASDIRSDTVRIPGTKRETRDRWVPLRPEVRAVLKRRAKGRDEGPLFDVWGNARRDLAQACERAGIAPVSHNDLRRTFATWLAEAGVPEGVVASLMGHASSAMVRRVYTKIGRKAQKEAVAKLPSLGRKRR